VMVAPTRLFLIKYRLFSANAENGNYIVTTFMGFSAPTGDDGNSNRYGVITLRSLPVKTRDPTPGMIVGRIPTLCLVARGQFWR
jgi:hypothetical protein